jgi:PX domain
MFIADEGDLNESMVLNNYELHN